MEKMTNIDSLSFRAQDYAAAALDPKRHQNHRKRTSRNSIFDYFKQPDQTVHRKDPNYEFSMNIYRSIEDHPQDR